MTKLPKQLEERMNETDEEAGYFLQLRFGLFAIVSKEDFEWASKFKWYVSNPKLRRKPVYPFRLGCASEVDTKAKPKRVRIALHREVMKNKITVDRPIVDHINGCTLDNRRSNLRACTHAQNCQNFQTKTKVGMSSKFFGVCFRKRAGARQWVAQISHKHKKTHIGYFKNEMEAALAYDKKARELHGEFARLNFRKPLSAWQKAWGQE
jgi:hypothetical protein